MTFRMDIVGAILAIGLVLLSFSPQASAQEKSASSTQPVLVELFTSQGCKSCPAAERVLSDLKDREGVVVLAWHVDYWNSEKWVDPFSSRAFSSRQIAYAKSFKSERIYTPQMIVDGRSEFNGRERSKARASIGEARSRVKASIEISTHPSEEGPDTIVACLRVDGLGEFEPDRVARIILVVTEDNLSVSVGGGENAARTLEHDAVVRWARVAGETHGEAFERDVSVPLNPAWKLDDLRLVAFVQDQATQEILAVKNLTFRKVASIIGY